MWFESTLRHGCNPKMTDITLEEEWQLYKDAYELGFTCFEYSNSEFVEIMRESDDPELVWMNGTREHPPIQDLVKEGQHKNGCQEAIWNAEDELGIGENDGWGEAYGVIEGVVISWEAGAFDSIMNKEYNPDRIPFVDSFEEQ